MSGDKDFQGDNTSIFNGAAKAVRGFIEADSLLQEWSACRQLVLDGLAETPTWVSSLPVLSCLAVGGTIEDAIPVSAACFSLDYAAHMLDSIADDDINPDNEAISTAEALNFSTSLIFTAYHFLVGIRPPKKMLRVADIFSEVGFKATAGQHQSFSRAGNSLATDDALSKYWHEVILRSGSMFRFATAGGAAAGTGNKRFIEALGDYGSAIGVIMQIQDDCRDILNIRTGKWEITLPVLMYSASMGSQDIVLPDASSKEALVTVLKGAQVIDALSIILQEWQTIALESLIPLGESNLITTLKDLLCDISGLPLLSINSKD